MTAATTREQIRLRCLEMAREDIRKSGLGMDKSGTDQCFCRAGEFYQWVCSQSGQPSTLQSEGPETPAPNRRGQRRKSSVVR